MSIQFLFTGDTDNVIELDAFTNSVAGTYINDATVTVTLYDRDDTEMSGETWPKAMSYVAGSNGKYRATIGKAVPIVEGNEYKAKVAADGGTGLERDFWCTAIGKQSKC